MEKNLAAFARLITLATWLCVPGVKSPAAAPSLVGSRAREPLEDRGAHPAPFLLALGLCPESGFRRQGKAPPLLFSLRYFRTEDGKHGAVCAKSEDPADADAASAILPTTVKPPGAARPAPGSVRNNPVLPRSPRAGETHPGAALTIRVNQTAQRLSVVLQGSPVEELSAVAVSTGRPGAATRTPDGLFRINPHEVRERRQSHFASRLLKRPVFLTHAIQIVGGIFMHDASHGAMAYLGQKRSHGCVRVDRRKMPEIFRLVRRHRFDTRVHIFHQGS